MMYMARDRNSTARYQAVHLVSLALSAVMVLAGLAWATSNIREIAPQNRAVVLRFGSLNRMQESGLLWALPAPFERVLLVPAAATVSERRIEGLRRSPAAEAGDSDAAESDALAGSGYLLTADASVVQLDIRVFYRVIDPFALCLAGQTHSAGIGPPCHAQRHSDLCLQRSGRHSRCPPGNGRLR